MNRIEKIIRNSMRQELMSQLSSSFITELQNHLFTNHYKDCNDISFIDTNKDNDGIDIIIYHYDDFEGLEPYTKKWYEKFYEIGDGGLIIHLHPDDYIFGLKHYDEILKDALKDVDRVLKHD